MSYWLKKIISHCFYPVPVVCVLGVIGVALLWRKRREKLGRVLVTLAMGWLLIAGLPILPSLLIPSLERSIAPCLDPVTALENESSAVAPDGVWIVVLGTGYNPNPEYPPTLRTSSTFWLRLLEGTRIHRRLPGSRLLISVAGKAGRDQKELFLDEAADLLGLGREALVLLDDARTTAEEAAQASKMVDGNTCFLVSEATHLPRARLLFEAQGLTVIPAPSRYAKPKQVLPTWSVLSFVPSSANLAQTRMVIHEYLGIGWAWLKGHLRRSSTHRTTAGSGV